MATLDAVELVVSPASRETSYVAMSRHENAKEAILDFFRLANEAASRLVNIKVSEPVSILNMKELHLGSPTLSTTGLFGANGLGHFYFEFEWESATNKGKDRIKLKVRGDDQASIDKRASVYNAFDRGLGDYFQSLSNNPYASAARREAGVLAKENPAIQEISPQFLLSWEDSETAMIGFVTEFLWDAELLDIGSAQGCWGVSDIKLALASMAKMHAKFIGNWAGMVRDCAVDKFLGSNIGDCVGWYRAKAMSSYRQDPSVFTPQRVRLLNAELDRIETAMYLLADSDLTFCHGNASIRNVCMRGKGAARRFCMFDWELATIHVPTRDVMEFLVSLSTGNLDGHSLEYFLEYYRQQFEIFSGRSLSIEDFKQQVRFSTSCMFFETLLTRWVRGSALREPELPLLLENCFEFLERYR